MGSSLGGFFLVCECLCKRILSSQQPDVCRAIPLHNYLRTSGTSKRSERASSSSVSFSLSLIVSSSLSTLSALFLPTSSLLVFRAFFFIFSHIQSFLFPSLSFTTPPCTHSFLYSPLSCCTAPMPEHMHVSVVPPLHQHIQSLLFFSSSWWPPCILPPSLVFLVLCCFHLSFLLTLVKTSPPPQAATTAEPICYSNSFSQKIVTWCVHVLHIRSINNHANYYIHGKQRRESHVRKYVLCITHRKSDLTNDSAAEVIIYIIHNQRWKRYSDATDTTMQKYPITSPVF